MVILFRKCCKLHLEAVKLYFTILNKPRIVVCDQAKINVRSSDKGSCHLLSLAVPFILSKN